MVEFEFYVCVDCGEIECCSIVCVFFLCYCFFVVVMVWLV